MTSTEHDDCKILLDRAFLGKTVTVFGADGHGEHGQSDFSKEFIVHGIMIISNEIFGNAAVLILTGQHLVNGHVSTDNNLRISLNKLLIEQEIDVTCWEYACFEHQHHGAVTIDLNVTKLLGY